MLIGHSAESPQKRGETDCLERAGSAMFRLRLNPRRDPDRDCAARESGADLEVMAADMATAAAKLVKTISLDYVASP
jgi:hypothetical protein